MAAPALLAEPGRLWPLRAVAIGLGLVAAPLLWWGLLWAIGHRPPPVAPSGLSVAAAVLAAVVIAPLMETLALAVLHWLAAIRLGAGLVPFVLLVAVAAVAAHWPPTVIRTPVTAAIFLVFAIQYSGWFRARGFKVAFGGTALAHAVYNGAVLALSPLWAVLLGPA